MITSVEDPFDMSMDDFNGSVVFDLSGRMRHGSYIGSDATAPNQET